MTNILVLCTGNSCRSQILHGLLNQKLNANYQIFSAGVEAHGLNQNAIKFLQKVKQIDISHHTSNHVDEYQNITFDYVITVCNHANEVCPVIPFKSKKIHHNFSDPSKVEGNEKEIEQAFKTTIESIDKFSDKFIDMIADEK